MTGEIGQSGGKARQEMQQEVLQNPVRAMEDAIALLQVVNQLKSGSDNKGLKHPLLFRGQLLAGAILLGLASELVLKALLMRDTGTSAKCHDLVKLFDLLPEGTMRCLEQRMPTAPSVYLDSSLEYPNITKALEANRNLFVDWRYVHERRNSIAETGVLMTALAAIIDTFGNHQNLRGQAAGIVERLLNSTLHDHAAKQSVSTMRRILSGGTSSLSCSARRPLMA